MKSSALPPALAKWTPPWKPSPSRFHAPISFSWIELNWSASGRVSFSHCHWITAASSSEVGVSALYSSSLGGCPGRQHRSNRP